MVALPTQGNLGSKKQGGCSGSSCGAGLEKVYPSTAVRFGAMNWIGEFKYKHGLVFKCGGDVVISTDRGIEIGRQVSLTCDGCDKSVTRQQIQTYINNSGAEYYRLRSGRILREASAQDLVEQRHLNSNERRECADCTVLAREMGLNMKIVTAEHLFGGERVVYYFMAEGRIDFRDLVRELAARHQTRIEMRQVGARDEARLVADVEICGRECCCKNFLKTLRPISMKMAKLQKSTLDLSKVSGRCGRLRCCLRYEHEGYEELARKLPAKGVRVQTHFGTGVVLNHQILTQLVLLRLDADEKMITVPLEEITAVDVPAPSPKPVPEPPPRRRDAAPRDASSDEPKQSRAAGRRRSRGRRDSAPQPPAQESADPHRAETTTPTASAQQRPPAGKDPSSPTARRESSQPAPDKTPDAAPRQPERESGFTPDAESTARPKRRRRNRRRRRGGDRPPGQPPAPSA